MVAKPFLKCVDGLFVVRPHLVLNTTRRSNSPSPEKGKPMGRLGGQCVEVVIQRVRAEERGGRTPGPAHTMSSHFKQIRGEAPRFRPPSIDSYPASRSHAAAACTRECSQGALILEKLPRFKPKTER